MSEMRATQASPYVDQLGDLIGAFYATYGTANEGPPRDVSVTAFSVPDGDFEQLSSGVFWFALATSLDRRQSGMPTTPLDSDLDLPLPLKIRMATHGSLVLRLYVALVYMREGPLHELIEGGARAANPCCGRVRRLLNCDYIRRIRNALAHGSLTPPAEPSCAKAACRGGSCREDGRHP